MGSGPFEVGVLQFAGLQVQGALMGCLSKQVDFCLVYHGLLVYSFLERRLQLLVEEAEVIGF